ncbi:MAG: hypothetical protein GEU80_11455 [Dehalococcoidia bacterium]|nr:hypothetical protein [Dehalococcoidia bacterium]
MGLGRLDVTVTAVQINGAPALLVESPGEAATVVTATTVEGRVTRIYVMRNPHKLARIADETALSR